MVYSAPCYVIATPCTFTDHSPLRRSTTITTKCQEIQFAFDYYAGGGPSPSCFFLIWFVLLGRSGVSDKNHCARLRSVVAYEEDEDVGNAFTGDYRAVGDPSLR